jgi:hypothetical protein
MVDRGCRFSSVRALSIAAVLLVTLVASPLRAQAPDITWSAPSGCPDASSVRARVAALLANSPAGEPLAAVARIESRRGAYMLALELEHGGRRASRKLEGRDCAALAEAAAFLIAVTVDPQLPEPSPEPAASEPAASPPARDEAVEQVAEPAPPPAEPPAAVEERPVRLRPDAYRAVLTGGLFVPGLAGPGAELGLGLGVGLGWLRLELRGAHVFARTREVAGAGARGRFSSQHLGLAACSEWGSRLRAGPCAWLSGVRTHAVLRGVEGARDSTLFWAMAGLSAALRARLGELLDLSVEGGAGLPLSARPRFVVGGLGTVGEVAYLTGFVRLGLGIELH